MDPQTNQLNGQDVSDRTPAITTREAARRTEATAGAVADFGRSSLLRRISRLTAIVCARDLITSASFHSISIAEFACTVWAEAPATGNSIVVWASAHLSMSPSHVTTGYQVINRDFFLLFCQYTATISLRLRLPQTGIGRHFGPDKTHNSGLSGRGNGFGTHRTVFENSRQDAAHADGPEITGLGGSRG